MDEENIENVDTKLLRKWLDWNGKCLEQGKQNNIEIAEASCSRKMVTTLTETVVMGFV